MSELKPCPIDIMKIRKLCYDGALRAHIEDEYIYLKDTVSGEVVRIGDAPARRAQPDNAPLTLEELRGMDGEPVKIDDNGAIFYGIVSLSGNCLAKEEAITLADGNFYLFRDMDVKVYPVLYRRKQEPEGGDRDAQR